MVWIAFAKSDPAAFVLSKVIMRAGRDKVVAADYHAWDRKTGTCIKDESPIAVVDRPVENEIAGSDQKAPMAPSTPKTNKNGR
jgi:hypothetical protein